MGQRSRDSRVSDPLEWTVACDRADSFAADLDRLERVEVIYETLPGWKSDISKCTTFDSLPPNCQAYVRYIEKYLGVKIQYIGVGPSRDSSIQMF